MRYTTRTRHGSSRQRTSLHNMCAHTHDKPDTAQQRLTHSTQHNSSTQQRPHREKPAPPPRPAAGATRSAHCSCLRPCLVWVATAAGKRRQISGNKKSQKAGDKSTALISPAPHSTHQPRPTQHSSAPPHTALISPAPHSTHQPRPTQHSSAPPHTALISPAPHSTHQPRPTQHSSAPPHLGHIRRGGHERQRLVGEEVVQRCEDPGLLREQDGLGVGRSLGQRARGLADLSAEDRDPVQRHLDLAGTAVRVDSALVVVPDLARERGIKRKKERERERERAG